MGRPGMLTIYAEEIMVGESVASQLPGRQVGPADVYRHILLAAEMTRQFGGVLAWRVLYDHEMNPENGADNGMDFWNNDIGMRIGAHVVENGGTWLDVVRLAREAVAASFDGTEYDDISTEWTRRTADQGIHVIYDRTYGPVLSDVGDIQTPFVPSF